MNRYCLLILCILLLAGCGKDDEKNTDWIVPTEHETMSSEMHRSENFMGIEKGEERTFGNYITCLNMGGELYFHKDILIQNEENGLSIHEGDIDRFVDKVQAKEINVLNNVIYFIDEANDSKICSVNCSGDAYREIVQSPADLLIVAEDLLIYTDQNSHLFVRYLGKTEQISDKSAIWINPYGDWIIFAEADNGFTVVGYNVKTMEKVSILDYAFTPTISQNFIYYQEKTQGFIYRLNLKNGVSELCIPRWGQFCQELDNKLYFMDSFGIQEYNMKTKKQRELYRPKDSEAVIDWMYACEDGIFFLERIQKDKKIYVLSETGDGFEVKEIG